MMVDLVFEQKMFEKPLDLLKFEEKKKLSNEVYQYTYFFNNSTEFLV